MPIADAQPDEIGSRPTTVDESPKAHRVFAGLKLELTDEDLKSPGVQKMLLDYLARAEMEISALKSFRDRFYNADKRNGVFEEKWKIHIASEVISTGMIAIGAAALVYGPTVWSIQPTGILALILGGALTLIGIIAKVIQR